MDKRELEVKLWKERNPQTHKEVVEIRKEVDNVLRGE